MTRGDVPMPSDPEWDADEDEVPVTALSGTPAAASGAVDQLADLLLELTLATLKAAVLLSEADENEWAVVSGRLHVFKTALNNLPDHPRPAKKIGFKPKRRKAPKRAPRTKRSKR
jgi:hypothetical protein